MRGAPVLLLPLLLLAPARADEPAKAPPAAAPAPAPAPVPAPAPAAAPAPAVPWAADLPAAREAAAKEGKRILAVVLEDAYPSEPCRRMERTLADPGAAGLLDAFVPLRVVEGEARAFSRPLGLEDLGHPYTALLAADGSVTAVLRGAYPFEAWAREARRLDAAATRWEAAKAAAAAAPGDARALFSVSEALRDLGRAAEADDVLSRAEKADGDGAAGLRPLFRYRRLEARVEDRMAVQDFEGARDLLDAYDREFPTSPRRRWVALLRAVTKAYRGEAEAALADLREIAADGKDPALAALAAEKAKAVERALEAKKR